MIGVGGDSWPVELRRRACAKLPPVIVYCLLMSEHSSLKMLIVVPMRCWLTVGIMVVV